MKHLKKFEMQEIKLKDYSERPPTREVVNLGRRRLSSLTNSYEKDDEYEFVENRITSSDPEDGGADHVVIIKRKIDNRCFKFQYSDWDRDYNFEDDFPETAQEVYPRAITKTIYE